MSLRQYLQAHFIDKPGMAASAGIPEARLEELIAMGAVPAATYVGTGTAISSAAFGVIGTSERVSGEFFRPEYLRWVRLADQAAPGEEKAAVESVLILELRAALVESGCVDPADKTAIDAKIGEYLPSFFDGTFGLCVADPSTGSGIVRKEASQERLTRLTENGTNPRPTGMRPVELLALMDDYAAAAMPFSPAEYERSSRKRLVDDLRPRVARI